MNDLNEDLRARRRQKIEEAMIDHDVLEDEIWDEIEQELEEEFEQRMTDIILLILGTFAVSCALLLLYNYY